MVNATNNQPQATYTKAPVAGNTPANNTTPNPNNAVNNTSGASGGNTPPSNNNTKKSKVKLKTVLAIIGIVLFLAVASIGVFISQRQQQVSGPVAPTAPTSRPSADEVTSDSCTLEFSVPAPSGVATCERKTALVIEDDNIIPLEDGDEITRGTEFYYRTTISSEELTSGNVVFSDELNENLEFIDAPDNSEGLEVDTQGDTTIIRKSLGQMQPGQEEQITFKVRVIETADIGSISNTARVTTDGTSNNNTSSCSIQTTVQATGEASCLSKRAYRLTANNEVGDEISANEDVSPGEHFLYRLSIAATEQTHSEVIVIDTLPANVTFVDSNLDDVVVDDENRVTIELDALLDNENTIIDLYVQVNDDAQNGEIENVARVFTGNDDEEPSSCSLALSVPTTACNSECTTNAQCPSTLSCIENRCRLEDNPTDEQCQPEVVELQCNSTCDPESDNTCPSNLECLSVGSEYRCRLAANSGSASCTTAEEPQCNDSCSSNSDCPDSFVCQETDDGNFCRLETNPGDNQCRPPETATPTPTPTPPATPTPTPAPGCNETCVTNADCSNTDHICYTTADGSNVCRLAENVESNTCTADQPELPEELPETGPAEWMTWLKTGLVTLGLGTILLLLL